MWTDGNSLSNQLTIFCLRLKTSPEHSEIFDLQIQPAGEYSRFFVQSRTHTAQRKTFGGDSWRVYIEGPSHLAGTVFDHNNGVYEVLFLIMEPGEYKIKMILDYTLCDGLIDPPMDWFKNGKKQLIETEKKTHYSWRPFLVGNLLGYSGKTADDIQDFLVFPFAVLVLSLILYKLPTYSCIVKNEVLLPRKSI